MGEKDKKLLRYYELAKKCALRHWRNEEDAEEFAAYAAINYLEKNKTRTLNFLYIDYLRIRSGRKGLPSYEEKLKLKGAFPLEWSESEKSLVPEAHQLEGLMWFETTVSDLKKIERAISILIGKWGFTEKEIGYCFGVSESRVSQTLKSLRKRVQKTLPKDEARRSEGQARGTQPLARMGEKESEGQPPIRPREGSAVEKEKPREVEDNHEEGFQEWLT